MSFSLTDNNVRKIRIGALSRSATLLAGATVMFALSACAGLHYDQDELRGFPYKIYQDRISDKEFRATGKNPVVQQLQPNGISARVTQDPLYPDFYVFLERTQSPKTFDAILSSILSFSGRNSLPVDARVLNRVTQLLAYNPANGASLQVVLVGTFGRESVRAALLGNPQMKHRLVLAGDKSYIHVFDATDASGVHIGVVADGVLAIQVDNPYEMPAVSAKIFDNHVLRVKALQNKNNDKVLGDYRKPTENAQTLDITGTEQVAEKKVELTDVSARQQKTFASVLALELDTTKPLFGLLSFAVRDSDLISGVRVRIIPVNADKKNGPTLFGPSGEVTLGLEFSILPKTSDKADAVRKVLKALMLKISGIAGLDETALSSIQFGENLGHVGVVGLNLSEDQAAKVIPQMLKDVQAALLEQDSVQLNQ